MARKIVIHGGAKLNGSIQVEGAKNSVLAIIVASILASKGEIKILDVPMLEDVKTLVQLLTELGIKTSMGNKSLNICAADVQSVEAPYDLVSKMRASFWVLGPLLARKKFARVAMPGGCDIGLRPIDLHLKGLTALGASFTNKQGFIEGRVLDRLRGANIYLDFPSVGATHTIMMAAALAEGRTVIENAACEPEIIDLANFINTMGGSIRGAGTNEIKIDGVSFLRGTEYTVIPDRIEAGTYMIAAAITRGSLLIKGVIAEHLYALSAKLREMGVEIEHVSSGIHVSVPNKPLLPASVKTFLYPAFPTDLQSQFVALLATIPGTSMMTESIFENRFMYVEELRRMGANIQVNGRSALISGTTLLTGTHVKASDLRNGAALILAGLAAEGVTEVSKLHHIERGYVDIVGKLRSVGAAIEYVESDSDVNLEVL